MTDLAQRKGTRDLCKRSVDDLNDTHKLFSKRTDPSTAALAQFMISPPFLGSRGPQGATKRPRYQTCLTTTVCRSPALLTGKLELGISHELLSMLLVNSYDMGPSKNGSVSRVQTVRKPVSVFGMALPASFCFELLTVGILRFA